MSQCNKCVPNDSQCFDCAVSATDEIEWWAMERVCPAILYVHRLLSADYNILCGNKCGLTPEEIGMDRFCIGCVPSHRELCGYHGCVENGLFSVKGISSFCYKHYGVFLKEMSN